MSDPFDHVIRETIALHTKCALLQAAELLIDIGHADAAEVIMDHMKAITDSRIADHFSKLALVRAEKR